jgi:hypothetical protein
MPIKNRTIGKKAKMKTGELNSINVAASNNLVKIENKT